MTPEEAQRLLLAAQTSSDKQQDRNAGIRLTESYAMYPTAAVSGWYLAHPDAHYFAVGKIDRDQVQDYARRNDVALEEMEKWLSPNLGYEVTAT